MKKLSIRAVGEILKLAGEVRDPYLEGKLGVIEEGA